ncbi:MAG: TetR family transcriptional regulator [Acidobacteriales bacterium]|nr:TetR family transcriptional regulator [Terriglobales bacterium]
MKPRLSTPKRSDQTRKAILGAAVREFSREGLAGARTDAIARDAKVNKALLYYYFKNKESLYGAVIDEAFGGLANAINPALSGSLPPREKILAYAGAHFDYIAAHVVYTRIVQREMMQAGRGASAQFQNIVQKYFRPIFGQLSEVIQEGIAAGEFRAVDPVHFIPSMISVIVFYFNSAPVVRLITGADPLSSESIAGRRAAVLDFISAALFRRELSVAPGGRS